MKNKFSIKNIFSFGKPKQETPKQDPTASSGVLGNSFSISFDGEKNYGEIGPVLDYSINNEALRSRSWSCYLTSEIGKTVMDKFSIWIVDKGLKIQCNPVKSVLESENIKLDSEIFNKNVEARFGLWAKSKNSSYSGMVSLNKIAKDCFRNAAIGGDVLVVLRLVDGTVKVELIDGAHVKSPITVNLEKGNKIIGGVEINAKGQHVAYHVSSGVLESERILARSETTGLQTAFLVYGSEYRLNDTRGLPIISTSLETLSKIERYKEAAVGAAEERQKIPFTIEHNHFSDGENPMASKMAGAFNSDLNSDTKGMIPRDEAGIKLAGQVAATSNKDVYNMPVGSSLKALNSNNEMFFKEFYSTNADIICSAVGIPPNVAFSIYNDSFSASRAATKDWEHTMEFKRDDFQNQFYNSIFAFWFHVEVLKNKINAPGYLQAFNSKDWVITESYLNSRFTGPMFPHIDPLKEAKAERLKLGNQADHLPLTTLEAATDALMSGDSVSNMEQFSKESDDAERLGIKPEENTNVISQD